MGKHNKTKKQFIDEATFLGEHIAKSEHSGIHNNQEVNADRRASAQLNSIVQAFDGLIYVCSQDYRIEFMNERLIERTGYDATGELCYKVLHERDSICPWCVNDRVHRGETVRWEVKSPKDDRWYYVVNTPINNEDGTISKQGIITDITDRKIADRALFMRSEEKYRELVENANSIILRMDKVGNVTFINEFAQRFFGFSAKEILGRNVVGTIVPEVESTGRDLKGMIEDVGLNPDSYVNNINENMRRNGKRVWIAWTNKPVYSEKGQIIDILCIGNDITERKHAEETIQYRADFENLIMNLSSLFINISAEELDNGINNALKQIGEFAAVDRSYVFQFYEDSRKMDNTHEWCRQGIEPQIHLLKDISVDKDLPWFWQIVKRKDIVHIPRVADLPPEAVAEKKHFESQGIQSLICLPMISRGELVGFLGFDSVREEKSWSADIISLLKIVGEIFVNALNRARVEKALRDSEERWHFALEGAGDGVWDWNAQTNKVFFSRKWKAMLGFEENKIGDSLDEWDKRVHPDDREHVYAEINRHFHGIMPVYVSEHRIMCRDGTYKWILDRGKVMSRTPDGKPLRVIGTHTDITERKRVEEDLRKSEEFLMSIFDQSPHPMWISDNQGMLIRINQSCCDLLNINKEEVVGKYNILQDNIVAQQGLLPLIQNVFLKGDKVHFEIIYDTAQLKILELQKRSFTVLDTSIFPIKDTSGNVTNAIIQHIDITARKQVEEALKESQQRLSDIINFLPDATVVIDKDGKVIAWNKAVEEMTGIKAEDMLGKGNYEYALPFYGERRPSLIDLVLKPQEEIEAKYVSTQRGELILSGEAYVSALKGGEAYLLGTACALRDSKGNTVGAVESIRDITERRHAEEALILAEGKYRGIFENAVMGIFQTTPGGRIIGANPAFAHILRYDSPQEVLDTVTDMKRQVYVDPRIRAELLKLLDEEGTIQGYEVQFFRKDGSIAWVALNGCAVRDDGGKLLYYEGSIQDITDRKILESQLLQAQKMEAIGTLAGGIAHDFNNILSAIMGYTDMALTNYKLDDNLRHYLNQVFKAGERARDLVKQILAFSRQTDEELHPLKVSPIVKEVLKLLRASLPSTIRIRQDIISTPDTILADPTHIHQLMMNLCTNAAHAMRDRKGELKVSLGPVEIKFRDDLIVRHGLIPGKYLKLTVSDTGTGITPEIINRVFDPFFTTKRPGEGTGMGLAVVHGIVKSYHGAITVESEMEKGTEFRVYLPLLTEIKGKRDVEAFTNIPKGDERILFVDDEEVLVQLGRKMLTSLGYKVTVRTSSLEALEFFRTHPERFDLVITDMTMPNMTGSELGQEIMRIRPDMPVILCTGFSEVITPEIAKAVGLKEFIMKPYVLNQIATVIRRVLDNKK